MSRVKSVTSEAVNGNAKAVGCRRVTGRNMANQHFLALSGVPAGKGLQCRIQGKVACRIRSLGQGICALGHHPPMIHCELVRRGNMDHAIVVAAGSDELKSDESCEQ